MSAWAAEVASVVKVSNLGPRYAEMLRAHAWTWTVQEDPSIPRDVFLYCKAHLRSGATLPPPQQLTPFKINGERTAIPSAACAAGAGWLKVLPL